MIKQSFSIFLAIFATTFLGSALFDSAQAQHYQSAYYGSSWRSAPTPSSRVATIPSYGRKAVKQQNNQRRNANAYQQAQQNQFNTLADTGFYLGLSLGKGKSTGQPTSAYCDPELPGNCSGDGALEQDTSSMGLVFGLAVSSATRLELTYTKYSDLKYGDTATHSDYFGSRELNVSGGDIESNVLMANFFYSLEDMFGNFSGGKIIPYFGFGIGLSFNTLSEYTIYDEDGYDLDDQCIGVPDSYDSEGNLIPGDLVYSFDGGWGIYDDGIHEVGILCDYMHLGEITYAGDTVQSIAWGVELGLTWKMQNQMYVDFFFKHTNLGEVSSSGMVVSDYEWMDYYYSGELYGEASGDYDYYIDEGAGINNEMIGLAPTSDIRAFYDAKEKSDISVTEFGIKFRIMF